MLLEPASPMPSLMIMHLVPGSEDCPVTGKSAKNVAVLTPAQHSVLEFLFFAGFRESER